MFESVMMTYAELMMLTSFRTSSKDHAWLMQRWNSLRSDCTAWIVAHGYVFNACDNRLRPRWSDFHSAPDENHRSWKERCRSRSWIRVLVFPKLDCKILSVFDVFLSADYSLVSMVHLYFQMSLPMNEFDFSGERKPPLLCIGVIERRILPEL